MSGTDECNEQLDQATRTRVLERDGFRCQMCGRHGPERDGLATLHVHHIERDPDEIGEHEPANLTTLCRRCHAWHHQQADEDDIPVEITDADRCVLLPQDTEILRVLADRGPLPTGDIAAAMATELSVDAIRERLWVLMGLDRLVETREDQVVDKDVETGEWGLVAQIERSTRGHIPDDPQLLLQRMEDEMVRAAIERGCNRSTVTAVFDISRRSSFYKEKRAAAYGFPLAAIQHGDGESRPGDGQSDKVPNAGTVDDAGQQRLDVVSDGGDCDAGPLTDETRETDSGLANGSQDGGSTEKTDCRQDVEPVDDDGDDVQAELRRAIESLQVVESAL